MRIHILPDDVASQIAAGEVIERPASVVKELVENSLDSNAKHIQITIQAAGRKLIEVADDGEGIAGDELQLAVQRHATSKLADAEDLFHIGTLGFRGEALSSMGSVSRMTITSRVQHAEMGARLLVEGGKINQVEPVGIPTGTVVRVEDLFYNVPARLKFLKTDATERRHIDALVTRYAIAYPSVRFHLRQDKRVGLQTSGNGDRREVLASLYGPDIGRQMLEVNSVREDISIKGYISPVGITRGSRRDITFFVNGRWVQDVSLTTALVNAYRTMIMAGRYPLAVIFVEIKPELVDVNVHPAKAEIRFHNQNEIFNSVQSAIRRALVAYTPVQEVTTRERWAYPERPEIAHRQVDIGWKMAADVQAEVQQKQERQDKEERKQLVMPRTKTPRLHLVGQVGMTFLVAEGPDGLYLIDQHAAHERVLFEKFLNQAKSEIPSQVLLEPVTINLGIEEARSLESQIPLLKQIGFQVEEFGPNSFVIRAMPTLLMGMEPGDALRVVIEDFEEDETPLQAEMEEKIIARVCKRAAIKAGQTLTTAEQEALLSDLEACDIPLTCPHGRPTMIHFSIDLIERQFGRKGPR
jgi:DNA mismatch repair protein MutL